MKKWKYFLTAVLCAAFIVPCAVPVSAVTVNRGDSSSGSSDSSDKDTDEEKEGSTLETTVVEKEKEETESTAGTVKEDIAEPADIVFVIDSTGSMASYIKNVATNLETFAKYLEDKGVEVRMAVVEYRDITFDGKNSTKIHTAGETPWHKTTAELVKTLNTIKSKVKGGGDVPETVVDALGYVADGESLKFSSAAHKFAIVLTDANYKEDNTKGLTMKSLIASLNDQNINTSVITQEKHYAVYKDLIGSTGMAANIKSKNFSDELIKLADVIFKTIEKEVIDEKIKSVTSVTVSCKGSNTIKVGNKAELNAVILPADADSKTVSWVVTDDKIAGISVSKDTRTCTVTGKKAGTTTITAVTEDGGFTGTYEIKVINGKVEDDPEDDDPEPAVEITADDMKIVPASKTIAKGKSFTIKIGLREDAVDEDLSKEEIEAMIDESIDSIAFRSSKSSVASVNKKTGKVTGKKKGSAVIKTTVNVADGTSRTFKTKVYVK